ncbi:MAG: NAD-dependent epimerase/dehydratase family protein [Chloroflexota bacterium]|nr:NAD-dependent epimerase/dehydratase family protein [Chloroflexota bacterium]
MNLLILGGTKFLGLHLVETACARGHEVTLFNRGQSNPGLFSDVEQLRGDRDGDMTALEGRHWDAAIDTSGYVPRVVGASARLLANSVNHYTFISSISVYADFSTVGMDESAPVGTLQDETVEEFTGEMYGPLKALCEQAAEAAMPGRVLTVRPGLIVGPHDPSDRFTYWPHRVAQGGEVLAPGKPEQGTQFIDARDLAAWIVRMVEAGHTGTYQATGPGYKLPIQRVLEECRVVSSSDARFTWVQDAFLVEKEVGPYVEMPLWIPRGPEDAGFAAVNCARAIAAGLTFRPLADTVRDTLAWDATRAPDTALKAGLTREKEAQLLREWHSAAHIS